MTAEGAAMFDEPEIEITMDYDPQLVGHVPGKIPVGMLVDEDQVPDYLQWLTHWMFTGCPEGEEWVRELVLEAIRDLNSVAPDEEAQALLDIADEGFFE